MPTKKKIDNNRLSKISQINLGLLLHAFYQINGTMQVLSGRVDALLGRINALADLNAFVFEDDERLVGDTVNIAAWFDSVVYAIGRLSPPQGLIHTEGEIEEAHEITARNLAAFEAGLKDDRKKK